jgi:[ribosomal protein S5]-alanine N-acetyltransferase
MLHLACGPCALRSWRPDDLDALVRLADNPAVGRQLRDRFPSPYTRAAGEAWLAHACSHRPETSFAIALGGEFAGGIGLRLGQDVERVSAEVGYWLGEPFWGRGIATAALTAFCRHAFAAFGLTRIFAVPFAENLASRRVLEKAGFTFQCVMRKSAVKQGRILDQALYDLVEG